MSDKEALIQLQQVMIQAHEEAIIGHLRSMVALAGITYKEKNE